MFLYNEHTDTDASGYLRVILRYPSLLKGTSFLTSRSVAHRNQTTYSNSNQYLNLGLWFFIFVYGAYCALSRKTVLSIMEGILHRLLSA